MLGENVMERQEEARDRVLEFVTIWGTLLVPLIPISLTFASIIERYQAVLHLGFYTSFCIALFGGIGLEVFGIASSETYGKMKSYEALRDKNDEPAPVEQIEILRKLYVGIIILIVTLLKFVPIIFPTTAILGVKIQDVSVGLSLFPLSLLAYITVSALVLRQQHNIRESKWIDINTTSEWTKIQKSINETIETLHETLESQIRIQNDTHNETIETLRETLESQMTLKNEITQSEFGTINETLALLQSQIDDTIETINATNQNIYSVKNESHDTTYETTPEVNKENHSNTVGDTRRVPEESQEDIILRLINTKWNTQQAINETGLSRSSVFRLKKKLEERIK